MESGTALKLKITSTTKSIRRKHHEVYLVLTLLWTAALTTLGGKICGLKPVCCSHRAHRKFLGKNCENIGRIDPPGSSMQLSPLSCAALSWCHCILQMIPGWDSRPLTTPCCLSSLPMFLEQSFPTQDNHFHPRYTSIQIFVK